MKLDDFLFQHFGLPEEIIVDLVNSGKRKSYKKGETLLPIANLTSKVYFIEKGLTKLFYYKDGKEITHYFLAENSFITRSENFLTGEEAAEKSRYGLMALEKGTVVYEFPFQKIKSWAETSVAMNKVIQEILLTILRGFSNRLNNLQFENAQDRYERLLQNQPEIILRAPLGDIASFLGISQQTLSVIRSKI